jgi:hypothetical protein
VLIPRPISNRRKVKKSGRTFIAGVCALTLLLVVSGASFAGPLSNPDPGSFGNDLEDTGLFLPENQVIGIELFDLPAQAGFSVGFEFGFYFAGDDVSDTSNLHTIFDHLDQNPNPDNPDGDQVAVIDFANGVVLDVDDNVLQSAFSPQGDPLPYIGFYVTIPGTTIFTEAANNAGVDMASTFPHLALDFYLLGFAIPNPDDPSEFVPATFEVVAGVTPVPEPGTVFLMFGALAALLMRRS